MASRFEWYSKQKIDEMLEGITVGGNPDALTRTTAMSLFATKQELAGLSPTVDLSAYDTRAVSESKYATKASLSSTVGNAVSGLAQQSGVDVLSGRVTQTERDIQALKASGGQAGGTGGVGAVEVPAGGTVPTDTGDGSFVLRGQV